MKFSRIVVTLGLMLMVAVGGLAYEVVKAGGPRVAADTGWDTPTPEPMSSR